jgi:hypothetical protein
MRTFTRWTNRHPLTAVLLGAICCIAIMLAAEKWDLSESGAVSWQVAATTRS